MIAIVAPLIFSSHSHSSRGEIPVQPDAPEGRQWLLDELAKPEYVAAKPSWWDQLIGSFMDWLNSLQAPDIGSGGFWLFVLGVVAVVGLIVAAFLIFGRPRLNRRSERDQQLFGRDDRRSAAAMRAAGASAAASGDWALAIEEEFRAIARELSDRTVVSLSPGTTAHGFAERAAIAFAGERAALSESAQSFDRVRYLGSDGTQGDYSALLALGGRLADASPVFDEAAPFDATLESAGTP